MAIYSFRAECVHDVEVLAKLLPTFSVRDGVLDITEHYGIPDCQVQVSTAAPIATLENAMRCVPDGHVMLQTLRPVPLAQNSLDRDYERS